MQSNVYLPTLAMSFVLVTSTSAINAAKPLSLQHESFKNLQQQFQVALPGSRASLASVKDALDIVQQRTDQNKTTHIRMQQYHSGFKVVGGYAILHSKKSLNQLLGSQEGVSMNGRLYGDLQTDLSEPGADFVEKGSFALQQFKDLYQGNDLGEEQVSPIVYIDDKDKAHWAYKVSVNIIHKDRIPERPTAIIDALTYKPYIQWNEIKTARSKIKGMGYGGNDKTGSYAYGKDFPLLELTRDNIKEKCYMENSAVKVIDMEHSYYPQEKTMQFDCKSNENDTTFYWTGYQADGYDKENGAFSPSNDALYSGAVIKNMYREWYNVDALTANGKPMKLVMRVHYGQEYSNAYWDGQQMTFGDGGPMFFPLVSLGISAHEISHGFTEQHSDLMYFRQSGGINESFSDMASQAAELYSTGINTWQIGGEVLKTAERKSLRYLDVPSNDGMSIDSALDYYQGMDVHHSSGVLNRLFYLMATTPGWDAHKAFNVMVKANMDYWTPTTNFDDAGCGVLNATHDLDYSVDEVKKALNQVAVDTQLCVIGMS